MNIGVIGPGDIGEVIVRKLRDADYPVRMANSRVPKGLLNKAKKETIVIDVGNYYPFRDGRIDEIENGLTESVWVERQLGRPVVKVFNSIIAKALAEAGRPAGSRDRVALPISGDDPKAKEIVAQVIDRIGFDSVDAGTIADSWRQQPGSPVYCTNPTKEELQLWLKNVDRSSLATGREKGLKAYLAVVDADYQTQVKSPSIGISRGIWQQEMKGVPPR